MRKQYTLPNCMFIFELISYSLKLKHEIKVSKKKTINYSKITVSQSHSPIKD